MTSYHEMSKREAAAALEEFQRERPPALLRLEQRLRDDGQPAEQLLDGSPESLTPLWVWAREQFAARAEPQREPVGPSWLRYGGGGAEPLLSDDSIDLADGLTSYLCRVVERGAPDAVWRVGYDRVKSYGWQNHPVLARGKEEFALGDYVAPRARRHVRGSRPELQPPGLPPVQPPEDDNLTTLARSLVTKLGGRADATPAVDEPLVEVDACNDGTYDWELSVREAIAADQSPVVDDLVAALGREPGVDEAVREDRERILVRAPSWTHDRVEEWASAFVRIRALP